jgi:polyisoprenoid-binding protein YceI
VLQRLTLALLLSALPCMGLAATPMYRLDPVHTRVLFAIEHAGFSNALGTVSGSEGELYFDPSDWAASRLDVRVPITRLDLGDAKWNQATLARNLLDGERFAEARFVSTRVEPIDDTHARVIGGLTLRGVTREVVLEVTLNALKRHPLPPFRRTAGFSATTTLSRRDFGLTAWSSMIGDNVQLRIEAEAVRDRTGADDEPPAASPAATVPTEPPARSTP